MRYGFNKSKKILLVSNGFHPEISPRSYRATELAKELCRQGHEMTVISKFRDHDYRDLLNEYPINLKMWRRSRLPKTPVFRTKFFSFLSRGFSRTLSVMFEYPAIEDMFKVKSVLKYESEYDLLISFAVPYPVHWGVAWARTTKIRIAAKWVADCGDPYMGDVLDSFRKPFYFGYLEKWFCRKADFISIPVESARSAYYAKYLDKIRVIPQGFDFDLAKPKENFPNRRIPEFAYAGSFLQGIRDPGPILKFLSQLNRSFKFLIFTNQPEVVKNYSEALKGKLFVYGLISRAELMKKLSDMDFLVNFDNNTNLNVPSKLIDYAIAGRPVLNIDKNFSSNILIEFLKGDYSNRMFLPDPAKHHIKNISQLFLDLI